MNINIKNYNINLKNKIEKKYIFINELICITYMGTC